MVQDKIEKCNELKYRSKKVFNYDRKYKENFTYLNSFNKDTEKINEIYGTKTLTYTFFRGFFPWSFCPRPKIYNLIYSYMLSTI